jgi:uncharacterized repeat protein (TIGR03806 family)
MLVSLAFLLAGCGGGDGARDPATPPVQEPPPTQPPPTQPPPTAEPPGETKGLDARPSNTTCIAPERATGSVTIGVQRAFPSLRLSDPVTKAQLNPISMQQAPGDARRWYVAGRLGVVRVFDNVETATTAPVFVDIGDRVESTCSECGLIGMAFHPDFPSTPRVYLAYTSKERTLRGPDTHLSEFTSPDGGLTLNPNSERILLTINKIGVNHHGGHIAFGRDGLLYFATGDGNGPAVDEAQNPKSLLGKFLRIDIRGTTGSALYRIPPDNPFAASTALCNETGAGTQNCPEIYAWGFRNPWRWSFDRQTGEIWAGDVGESSIEEVDRVVRGGNYGWRCFEGTQRSTLACSTPVNPRPPIAEYSHEIGRAVTGGFVYRGKAIPALVGRYVFADFVTGRVWDIPNGTQPTMTITGGLETGLHISSFAEDLDGELYVTNIGGNIHRITAAGSGGSGVATLLSATGCVSTSNPTLPASGLIPYAPNAAFWSDGATKERWIGLPNGQNITVGANGDWDFPRGTVLMKNFRLDDQLIETRLFMRHPDGVWAGYSYEWNAQGNDATLVRGGKQKPIDGQTWIYPNEAQCVQCHTEAAGDSLGLETRQLAFNIRYPQTGRDAHQLVTLDGINTLSPPIANPGGVTPYPDPSGSAGTLTERARAYLHTNCSQCHRPGGPTPSNMDLRYGTALANTNACNAVPEEGDLGIANARLIAPGAPDRSLIPTRMNRRGVPEAMPPLASTLVDTAGVKLIRDWITSLASCN